MDWNVAAKMEGPVMNISSLTDELDMLLFDYVARDNPKSNEDLKRYLRLYPQYREEIIEFTANWRALSIIEKVTPTPVLDSAIERRFLRRAEVRLRAMRRRHTSETDI
jgi:hypothetical protein